MTFLAWLYTQLKDPTAIGDLARDLKRDRNKPRLRTGEDLMDYLHDVTDRQRVHETGEEAWDQYQRSRVFSLPGETPGVKVFSEAGVLLGHTG